MLSGDITDRRFINDPAVSKDQINSLIFAGNDLKMAAQRETEDVFDSTGLSLTGISPGLPVWLRLFDRVWYNDALIRLERDWTLWRQ